MTANHVSPPGLPGGRGVRSVRLIYLATAGYLAAGLLTYIAWRVSGNAAWLDLFFRVPGALLAVALALVQLVISFRVCEQFSADEPLFKAWRLVSISSVCDLVRALAVEVFSPNWAGNPLAHIQGWSTSWETNIRQVGQAIGGPLRFALLAAGLFFAVRMYRRSGFLGRLKGVERLALLVACVYVTREFWDLSIALQHGKKAGWAEILNWPVDPLLCLLMAEAMLLYRSTRSMGPGWVGRSWIAYSLGVALVVAGNSLNWAAAYGFLPYPWSSVEWYVWIPAAAAFAVAPIYQLEVIRMASSPRPTR